MGFHHPDGIPFSALPVGASFRWAYDSPGHPSPVCVKISTMQYRKADGWKGAAGARTEVVAEA